MPKNKPPKRANKSKYKKAVRKMKGNSDLKRRLLRKLQLKKQLKSLASLTHRRIKIGWRYKFRDAAIRAGIAIIGRK